MEFERAAALRDRLEPLRWMRHQLERLRAAREMYSFIYPVSGPDGRRLWYLLHHGRVARVLAAPGDRETRRAAAAAIAEVYEDGAARGRLLALEEVDVVLLVAGWFRRHPEERAGALMPPAALALCRTPPT